MKIINLKVDKYKVINEMNIRFENTKNLNVIIGSNGSGKSTLLEVISRIFKDLYLGRNTKHVNFSYKIVYNINGHEIVIIRTESEKNKYKLSINNEEKSLKDNLVSILPDHIFSYYSGNDIKIQNIYEEIEKNFQRGARKGKEISLRNMLLIKNEHLKIAFLSLYVLNNKFSNKILKEMLGIKKIESVNIHLVSPKEYKSEGLLGTEGTINDFLEKLYKLSFSPILTEDKLHLNFLDEDLIKLKTKEDKIETIFANFEALLSYELLNNVEIELELKNKEIINFNDLSEGEKQLLLTMSSILVTSNSESLYLFDEPDTYLHPKWQKELAKHLNLIMAENQMIMTTHSPFSILESGENCAYKIEKGKIEVLNEEAKMYGIEKVLLSREYFDLDSLFNTEISEKIEERNELALNIFGEEEVKQINEINKLIEKYESYSHYSQKEKLLEEMEKKLKFLKESDA